MSPYSKGGFREIQAQREFRAIFIPHLNSSPATLLF